MPALDMARTLGATKRSKFIDMRHFYIKETIEEKNITLDYTTSRDLDADLFTEAIDRRQFEKLRAIVNVKEIPDMDKKMMEN